MNAEPALMSLTSVAKAIAEKRISSREATQSCLDRIAQWQPRLNAFMAIEAEAALAAADAADAAMAKGNQRGVLHGVPLAHKDMYYDAGRVVTCGSRDHQLGSQPSEIADNAMRAPSTSRALQAKSTCRMRLSRRRRFNQLVRLTKHLAHLLNRNAWELLEKIADRPAALQGVEQRLDRHPRARPGLTGLGRHRLPRCAAVGRRHLLGLVALREERHDRAG